MSVWQNFVGVAALAGLALVWLVAVLALIGVLGWLFERGKMGNSRDNQTATAAGTGAMALQELLQPEARYVREAKVEAEGEGGTGGRKTKPTTGGRRLTEILGGRPPEG